VVRGFFPLDEELELLPGRLTPGLFDKLAQLGASIPSFEQAARMFNGFTRVKVSEATARRATQTVGATCVALQDAIVAALEQEPVAAPTGPEKQLMGVDGAMVPLVGGQWAEVKTLTIGTVQPPQQVKGESVVKTGDLSYFSRVSTAETFERRALYETHRRGVETARQVVAVNDGAEWIQGFIDCHRPDALRVLDFWHAAGYISDIGQAVWGAAAPELAAWTHLQLHRLKYEGPELLLQNLHTCVASHGLHGERATLANDALAYLDKRIALMQYPAYRAQGCPIGSGTSESGNKLVVEARLKGAGMHWALANVNPMLATRNLICNKEWETAWPDLVYYLRGQLRSRSTARRQQRRAEAAPPPEPVSPAKRSPSRKRPARSRGRHKPGPNHPWRTTYKALRPRF
jgi:hypothetical protein